jgi:mono/diheme cytochrome c family protein
MAIGVLAAAGFGHGGRLRAAAPQAANAQAVTSAAVSAASSRALLNDYCVICHNDGLKTAGLMLDKSDVQHVGAGAEVWEKVVKKVRTGAMPPAGRQRPDHRASEAFVTWLETELDREAAVHPNPGRPADHRLNQVEYSNAIRDLLALDIDAGSLLPADESDHGFDNIADVLSISPTLLERYMLAAQKISRLAIGDPGIGPAIETFNISRSLRQDERMHEDLPYDTRGGALIRHYFPLDGEYVVKIRLARNFTDSVIRAIGTREQIDVLLDGARITRFNIGGECVEGSQDPKCLKTSFGYQTPQYALTADDALQVRFPAKAGMHSLGAAFVKKGATTEGLGATLLPPRHSSSTYEAPRMDMEYVRLEGPFDATGPGDTPSRQQIFVCRPTSSGERSGAGLGGPRKRSESSGVEGPPRVISEEDSCAKKILTPLARRAYRRPVVDADVEPLLRFYRSGRHEGTFERGIQAALGRLLVSPQFLFRLERDPADLGPGGPYRISDLELASRLSFFLWSSIPDDQLLDVAARGRLKDPKILEEQVRRMLADSRATALVVNFGGQWLFLRNMKAVDPDANAFPDFDENLRDAFRRETELFLESQMREDRPMAELLTANYTFANERLARFYGIRNVYGPHFRRVQTDPHRAGLLGHGSILTVTSYATRTSPVLRGKYLLDNILGAPPPPPPPDVPPLPEISARERPEVSMRELMEAHRQNPVCATCHQRMDPLGFALENFDAIGKWRTTEGHAPIDASGVLPDGTKFGGPDEFRKALMAHRDEFVRTFTERLLTYALGRAVAYYDMPALRAIIREAAPSDYRWSSLILGVVNSRPFQMRASQEVETTGQ